MNTVSTPNPLVKRDEKSKLRKLAEFENSMMNQSKSLDKYMRGVKDGAGMMWDLLHKEERESRINNFKEQMEKWKNAVKIMRRVK